MMSRSPSTFPLSHLPCELLDEIFLYFLQPTSLRDLFLLRTLSPFFRDFIDNKSNLWLSLQENLSEIHFYCPEDYYQLFVRDILYTKEYDYRFILPHDGTSETIPFSSQSLSELNLQVLKTSRLEYLKRFTGAFRNNNGWADHFPNTAGSLIKKVLRIPITDSLIPSLLNSLKRPSPAILPNFYQFALAHLPPLVKESLRDTPLVFVLDSKSMGKERGKGDNDSKPALPLHYSEFRELVFFYLRFSHSRWARCVSLARQIIQHPASYFGFIWWYSCYIPLMILALEVVYYGFPVLKEIYLTVMDCNVGGDWELENGNCQCSMSMNPSTVWISPYSPCYGSIHPEDEFQKVMNNPAVMDCLLLPLGVLFTAPFAWLLRKYPRFHLSTSKTSDLYLVWVFLVAGEFLLENHLDYPSDPNRLIVGISSAINTFLLQHFSWVGLLNLQRICLRAVLVVRPYYHLATALELVLATESLDVEDLRDIAAIVHYEVDGQVEHILYDPSPPYLFKMFPLPIHPPLITNTRARKISFLVRYKRVVIKVVICCIASLMILWVAIFGNCPMSSSVWLVLFCPSKFIIEGLQLQKSKTL